MRFSEGFKDQAWGKKQSFHNSEIIWSKTKQKTKKHEQKKKSNKHQPTTMTFLETVLCYSCCGRHGLSGGIMLS